MGHTSGSTVDEGASEEVGASTVPSGLLKDSLSDVAGPATASPLVIGIGASAGGLEALRALVGQLLGDQGACYAVAQHLSPTHRSMLVDLLARESSLRVLEISHGLVPQAGVVYVAPAGCHVRFSQGAFQLESASRAGIPKPSIDAFFESLALAFGSRAVGVILSGTGSDGSRGVRALNAAGGCSVVQDPADAKYDGMPRAAIDTGCVDFVVPASEIGQRLAKLLQAHRDDPAVDLGGHGEAIQPVIDRIVLTVKRRAGFDLSLYKARPLERRIRRRVAATESQSLEDYAALLQNSGQEVERVVREMFISVTEFFRDPEAFEVLDQQLGELLLEKDAEEELRIWVPGCATGEEAYSLAMLVAEHLERLQRWPNVRIFASDLDLNALAVARRGSYPLSALDSVPARYAEKYLVVDAGTCRVTKRVRDMVIFSEHNLLRDPTFLRLDLVSCRNLLIYLQPDVQHGLLSAFAHALRPGGLMFLGKAEALHARNELFTPLSGPAQLFRTAGVAMPARPARARVAPAPPRAPFVSAQPGRWDPNSWLARAHEAGLLPPLVVVDDEGMVRHLFGDLSPYLRMPSGGATLNLVALAHEALRLPLRSTLLKTQREPSQRLVTDVVMDSDSLRSARLTAWRREEAGIPPLTLVMFEEREVLRSAGLGVPTNDDAQQQELQRSALEEQLTATREHLSTVISELESANEELQSLNEEMQSANEELQSTNEELETSNEELQSTNEELITVNEELESRTAELSLLNADLHNVKNSLVDPIIVVDEHRRVTLFNPPAQQVFALDGGSVGALLFSLPCLVDLGVAATSIHRVIEGAPMSEHQLTGGSRSFLMRVLPYLDIAGRCKGAVLTFTDNTDLLGTARQLSETARRLQEAEQFASATIEALPKKIGVIDAQGRLVKANRLWREEAALQLQGSRCCAEGDDFLQACRVAQSVGDNVAGAFLDGLQKVMRGEVEQYEQGYTTPARSGISAISYWAAMVTPFSPGGNCTHWVVSIQDVTQSKLQELQIMLQARALNSSISPITIVDASLPDMPLVYVNSAFESLTGYAASEVLGLNCRFLQGTDRQQAGIDQIHRALVARESCRVLLRNYRKNGNLFWNELTLSPIVDNGRLIHVVGLQRDMTADLASEQALKASLQRESQALAFAGLGSLEWDVRGGTFALSERHARLLGVSSEVRSLSFVDYRQRVHQDDLPLFDESVKLCVAGHSSLDIEYRVLWPDGSVHWLHTLGNVVADADDVARRVLGLTQDITARKDAEDRVRFIAHHDALTGLPNRVLLRDRFQLALNGARRNRSRLALMFIDLDHFKDINDSLGHETGDAVLVAIAERLRTCLRDTDTVCRQSGDEFIALMPGVRDANDAAHLADKMLESIAQPMQVLGHELRITCSAGLSMYPDDGDTVDLLMRHADSAMYHAKGTGRNTSAFFAQDLNRRHQERLSVSTALRQAVPRGELRLHYQPQFDVRSGALRGVEALVRWQHPERGLVYPDSFIPIAEESDLIHLVGEWVLREACRQAAEWHESGVLSVPMSVNLSPMQLRQRNIIEKVVSALHDSGLEPRWLELELTERAIIHNADSASELLADFRRAGVRLALDDFGTGYASLSYLHRFPVQTLKIDRTFVMASPDDASASAIVRAVINLARSMNLSVVAEGVETQAQLAFLDREQCTAFQGFLSGPGTPAEGFEAHVRGYTAATQH